jgi:hypothetical protein
MALTSDEIRRDREWSQQIRERDRYQCRRCHVSGHVEAAHIFSRRIKATRWDLDNGITLCAGPRGAESCHAWFDSHRRTGALEWVAEAIGRDTFEMVQQKALTLTKRVPRDMG